MEQIIEKIKNLTTKDAKTALIIISAIDKDLVNKALNCLKD